MRRAQHRPWKPATVAGMRNTPMAARKKTPKTPEPTLRHVWLAGLGVIAVAHREAQSASRDAAARFQTARQQAEKLASDTQREVWGRLASVREQGEARVDQFSADIEARLEPVLAKLGLKKTVRTPAAKSRARKAAKKAKKATASRTRTRASSSRKPAAKRTRAGRA